MFTGIIEEIGQVKWIINQVDSMRLTIKANLVLKDIKLGDSIAVNGVCLTVTDYNQDSFSVDIMHETIKVTSLAVIKPGSILNLERALAVGGRLGGHFVSGHVDGIGIIKAVKPYANAIYYIIELDTNLIKYCLDKGSIAVDGTSLTIFGIADNKITLSLIPHTVKNSVLGQKIVGDKVNIECDMLGKYVVKLLNEDKPKANNIDKDFLRKNGF